MTVFGVQITVTELLMIIVLAIVSLERLIMLYVRITPNKEDDKRLAEFHAKYPWLQQAMSKAFQLVKKKALEGEIQHAERFGKFIEILEKDYMSFFDASMPDCLKQVAEQYATAEHAKDKNLELINKVLNKF